MKLEHAYDSSHLANVQVPLNSFELSLIVGTLIDQYHDVKDATPDHIDELSDLKVIIAKINHYEDKALAVDEGKTEA